jgi:GntR family transcriptional regulator
VKKRGLERNGYLPLYRQLEEILKQRIANQEWVSGNRIPTETELIEEFDVSRTTVREAVDQLVQEGLLDRLQGRGTFVRRQPLEIPLGPLTGFAEEVVELGRIPSAILISTELTRDFFYEAHQLKVSHEEAVLRIERVRLADGEPIALERTFWPRDIGELLLEEDLNQAHFYPILESHGIYLREADETILAVNASEEEVRVLGVEPGEALLEMRRVSYGEDGRPVEFVRNRYRSDKYFYQVHLRRGQSR